LSFLCGSSGFTGIFTVFTVFTVFAFFTIFFTVSTVSTVSTALAVIFTASTVATAFAAFTAFTVSSVIVPSTSSKHQFLVVNSTAENTQDTPWVTQSEVLLSGPPSRSVGRRRPQVYAEKCLGWERHWQPASAPHKVYKLPSLGMTEPF
jgi:hypothetical protein